jgi:Tfp pilus assembly PilM family ATPase
MRDFLERWWYGREPILGIDIRDNGIVVADVDLRGKNQWHSSEALSTDSGAGGLLRDTRAFSSFLGDFISLSRTTLERCAVGFPASLTSISCLVLPHEVVERSEKVRYEAALERAHLRPQDVRGRVYSIRGGSAGGPNTLLVAAKAADVALLEDGVALAGLEISCLTPRVFALHHLVSLAGLVRNGERIVYSERSSRSSVLHLFKGSHYHSTICESGDLWKEMMSRTVQEL